MAERNRVNLSLSDRQIEDLGWLATERGLLPGALAREMVDDAIQAALADAQTRARWEQDRALDVAAREVLPDIVAALGTEGVPEVLAGQTAGAGLEQLRVAAWLIQISRWLADPRPRAVKGPPVPLGIWANLYVPGGDVGAALDVAGGGDGSARRRAAGQGNPGVSDKRRLSDMAPAGQGPAGGPDGR